MMQYKAVFELFQNYPCKFMEANHDIIEYSISFYPFESGKEGKKLQKSEYLKIE